MGVQGKTVRHRCPLKEGNTKRQEEDEIRQEKLKLNPGTRDTDTVTL